jgi:DNA-directed RNA polymerase subunit RPC12/RpoP
VTNEVRCPHCGKMQLPTIRVQTIESSGEKAGAKDDPRKALRVLLVLLLSLTIFGLPIAYWLCQRFEKEYPVRAEPVLSYSYRCSLCGYAWTWRTDEPLPRRATGTFTEKRESGSTSSPHEGIANISASHDFSTR